MEHGLGTSYVTYVMENGDRIYARGNFLAHRLPGIDGSGMLKNMTELTITGGTGRLLAIRGIVRAETVNDNAAFNRNRSEMEYWMES